MRAVLFLVENHLKYKYTLYDGGVLKTLTWVCVDCVEVLARQGPIKYLSVDGTFGAPRSYHDSCLLPLCADAHAHRAGTNRQRMQLFLIVVVDTLTGRLRTLGAAADTTAHRVSV